MAVLERRRLTDTLLYGKCAPHEVEWRCQILASLTSDDASAVTCAPFVGYEAYLHLARAVLLRQRLCPDCLLPSAAQEKQIISCAQMALKLMSAPRLHEDLSFSTEALLLHEARCALFEVVRMSRSHHTALRAAMDNLQASGTITRRRMERVLQDTSQRFRGQKAKAEADIESLGVQSCAHCGAREVHATQFKRCSACKGPRFCSKDCQLANWPQHKAACKAARKAAAGAASDDA
jgi:hypothetical protein